MHYSIQLLNSLHHVIGSKFHYLVRVTLYLTSKFCHSIFVNSLACFFFFYLEYDNIRVRNHIQFEEQKMSPALSVIWSGLIWTRLIEIDIRLLQLLCSRVIFCQLIQRQKRRSTTILRFLDNFFRAKSCKWHLF